MIFGRIAVFSVLIAYVTSDYEWQKSGLDWHLTKESFSSKFRDRESPSRLKKILKDTRIIFIGDSLTRYQYLNFIHILHTNSWLLSSFPHLELEGNWPSWKSFHQGTSFRFGCKELCDCYRDRHFHNLGPVVKENRHYRDDSMNISVHFFQWFPPSIPIMLNNVPTLADFEMFCRDDEHRSNLLAQYRPESDYIFPDIIDFMRKIIQPLRPNHLIINQGLWHDNRLRSNNTYKQEFFSTAKAISSAFIWKTTTARCFNEPDTGIDGPEFRAELLANNVSIFDAYKITLGITLHKKEEKANRVCVDIWHYMPFVYRELNKGLLDFLILHRDIQP